MLHHGQQPGKASVMFLPMIDLDPGDTSCIYSKLHFVTAQAKRYDVTPVLTFDQPLYWKAMMIIRSQPDDSDLKCMVLRLGGFHMQMRFLCSIGHLACASNTVSHMLTGKAVSRTVRSPAGRCCTQYHSCGRYIQRSSTKQEADDSEAVGVLHNPERSDDDDETHDLDMIPTD